MKQYRILILTDHSGHSPENSLYAIASAMFAHPLCQSVDVATRANNANDFFFRPTI